MVKDINKTRLTYFMSLISFDTPPPPPAPPENIRKPLVFRCFQGVSKEISGMKRINELNVLKVSKLTVNTQELI